MSVRSRRGRVFKQHLLAIALVAGCLLNALGERSAAAGWPSKRTDCASFVDPSRVDAWRDDGASVTSFQVRRGQFWQRIDGKKYVFEIVSLTRSGTREVIQKMQALIAGWAATPNEPVAAVPDPEAPGTTLEAIAESIESAHFLTPEQAEFHIEGLRKHGKRWLQENFHGFYGTAAPLGLMTVQFMEWQMRRDRKVNWTDWGEALSFHAQHLRERGPTILRDNVLTMFKGLILVGTLAPLWSALSSAPQEVVQQEFKRVGTHYLGPFARWLQSLLADREGDGHELGSRVMSELKDYRARIEAIRLSHLTDSEKREAFSQLEKQQRKSFYALSLEAGSRKTIPEREGRRAFADFMFTTSFYHGQMIINREAILRGQERIEAMLKLEASGAITTTERKRREAEERLYIESATQGVGVAAANLLMTCLGYREGCGSISNAGDPNHRANQPFDDLMVSQMRQLRIEVFLEHYGGAIDQAVSSIELGLNGKDVREVISEQLRATGGRGPIRVPTTPSQGPR